MSWRYRHSVLVLTTAAFAATMVARLMISPVVPDITGTFDITTGDIGLALTGMWTAYALSQYPGGVLASRVGERAVILFSTGLIGLASLALAFVPVFSLFAVATVALGAAAGLPYSSTTSLLAKNFEDVGRAIGFYISGGPVAGLIVPIVATSIAALYGWRAAMLLGAGLAIPILVVVRWGIRPTPPTESPNNERTAVSVETVVELLSRRQVAFTVVLAVGGAFAWQATASFLPTFLVEHQNLSPAKAGLFFALYFVVHGLTQPVTGWLSDRFGRNAAAVATMGSGLLGYTTLVLAPSSTFVFVAVLLVGLGMSWAAPVQSRFMDQFTEAERTSSFGLVRTVYMVLGSSGSVVVGMLADGFGWTAAFGLLASVMGFELVVLGLYETLS